MLRKYCSFLQIENVWKPCLERVYRSHFSSSIDSPSVSVSHFGNSHTISNIFMIIPFVTVICDQWSYWCYCCSCFGIFLAVNYFLIKVCTFFLDILCPWCLVTQLGPTLCDPMDCSLPGCSIHGDSPGKNFWSGLPCLPPGDLPNPGIEPRSPTLKADDFLPSEPRTPKTYCYCMLNRPQ